MDEASNSLQVEKEVSPKFFCKGFQSGFQVPTGGLEVSSHTHAHTQNPVGT